MNRSRRKLSSPTENLMDAAKLSLSTSQTLSPSGPVCVDLALDTAAEHQIFGIACARLHPGDVSIVKVVEGVEPGARNAGVKGSQRQRCPASPAPADVYGRRPVYIAQEVGVDGSAGRVSIQDQRPCGLVPPLAGIRDRAQLDHASQAVERYRLVLRGAGR